MGAPKQQKDEAELLAQMYDDGQPLNRLTAEVKLIGLTELESAMVLVVFNATRGALYPLHWCPLAAPDFEAFAEAFGCTKQEARACLDGLVERDLIRARERPDRGKCLFYKINYAGMRRAAKIAVGIPVKPRWRDQAEDRSLSTPETAESLMEQWDGERLSVRKEASSEQTS